MQHWIFDLDGTLVDSFPAYTKAMTDVMREFGVILSAEEQEEIRHFFPKVFLARHLADDQLAPALERTLAITLQRLPDIPTYDGVHELLDFLRSKQCRLSVFTARERITALEILEATGLRRHFAHVVTRDCIANPKPHPDGIHRILGESQTLPAVTVMIGDHAMDMESAKSAGVKGISVSWDGAESAAKDLSDLHFTSVDELRSWAAAQLG